MSVDKAGSGGGSSASSANDRADERSRTEEAKDTKTDAPSSTASEKPEVTVAEVAVEQKQRPSQAEVEAQRTRNRTEVSPANYTEYQLQGAGPAATDHPPATDGTKGTGGFRRGELEPTLADADPNATSATPASLTKTVGEDGGTVITATEEDDQINVGPATGGGLEVTSGDTTLTLTEAEAENLTIHAGGGDDTVVVDPSVTQGITIHGGAGNDTVTGGGGNDHIYGGAGRDNLRGAGGDDHIYGGANNDQLVGGAGNDVIQGDDGHDFIMGGAGADRLDGGFGADAIYADADDIEIKAGGRGRRGDRDTDTIIGEHGMIDPSPGAEEDVTLRYDPAEVDRYLREHPELVIDGDEVFEARVRADLGVMLGTQQGRGLLDTITAEAADRGESITLREAFGVANGRYDPPTNEATSGNWAGTWDGIGDTRVNNHPLPMLYHELVHAHQDLIGGVTEPRSRGMSIFRGGDAIPNIERQATGLSWMRSR